jgi:ribose transport system ATP-binding protein
MEALNQLGHGTLDPDARVGSLSIAEQQIVEIARALAIGCRVLILDEPTSSLTRQDLENLFSLLRRLRSQGHAIVYISHFLEEVKEICDTYTVLRDGQTAGSGRIIEITIDAMVRRMIGRQVDQLYPRSPRRKGEVLLDVSGLSGPVKPRGASIALHRGEIVGIAGLIGAGRTEFLRSIFGLAPVTEGTVRVALGTGPASPTRRWAQGAGYLSEDRGREGVALPLSITQNILMNLRNDVNRLGLYRPSVHRDRAAEWIRRLSIRTSGPDQTLSALSGGNQQKVALARLLHEDVDILLLDEPTRGIDVASKFQIYDLLDRLASGEGGRKPRGILLVSSYFPELLGICDRIAVMSRGHLGEARPTESWSAQALMLEAFGQGNTAP